MCGCFAPACRWRLIDGRVVTGWAQPHDVRRACAGIDLPEMKSRQEFVQRDAEVVGELLPMPLLGERGALLPAIDRPTAYAHGIGECLRTVPAGSSQPPHEVST